MIALLCFIGESFHVIIALRSKPVTCVTNFMLFKFVNKCVKNATKYHGLFNRWQKNAIFTHCYFINGQFCFWNFVIVISSGNLHLRDDIVLVNSRKVCFAVIITAFVLMPPVYAEKGNSMYKYLEERYNSKILRFYGSLLFMIATLLWNSVALYAPSISLSGVTGVPV